jgi:hypothetical protein
MADSTIVHFTFGLADPHLEDEDRLRFTNQLLPELRQRDEVEQAHRVEAATLESGAKGYQQLWGWLSADVSVKNVTGFLTWLGSRLSDKPSEVMVKIGDKEVQIKSDALADPEATAKWLIAALKEESGV